MAKAAPSAVKFPSAFTLFKPSYDALMVNMWTFLVLLGLPLACSMLAFLLASTGNAGDVFEGLGHGLPRVLVLMSDCLTILLAPCIPYVQLRSVRDEEVSIGEALQAGMKFFWQFWGLTILVSLIILGGFLLFIVPGLFMLRRYLLAPLYLYDKGKGIGEALRVSAADSRQFPRAIWGLIGVYLLICLPLVYPPLFLVTAALAIAYYCAPAVRYMQIKQAKKKA